MLESYFKKHLYADSHVLAQQTDCEAARLIGEKFDVRIYRPRGSEGLTIPEKLPAALDRAVQVCKTMGRNSPQYVTSEMILPIVGTNDASVRSFLHAVNIVLSLEV